MFVFGAETWVLSALMEKKLEGGHMGFLLQATKMKGKSLKYGSWRKVVSYIVIQGAETKTLQIHIQRRQAKVSEWVALWTIFDICTMDTGCKGGGESRIRGGESQ